MRMDETLHRIAERCKNFAVFFLVDTTQVGRRAPNRNIRWLFLTHNFLNRYQISTKCMSCMTPVRSCFSIVTSTSWSIWAPVITTKVSVFSVPYYFCLFVCFLIYFYFEFAWLLTVNWPIDDPQEMIDIVETVYRGSRKGRGLVVAPKDYSTKYKY